MTETFVIHACPSGVGSPERNGRTYTASIKEPGFASAGMEKLSPTTVQPFVPATPGGHVPPSDLLSDLPFIHDPVTLAYPPEPVKLCVRTDADMLYITPGTTSGIRCDTRWYTLPFVPLKKRLVREPPGKGTDVDLE